MWLAALGAAALRGARPRLSRTRVSAITDEMAATQSEAVRLAREFGFAGVELRNVPETGKPFAALSEPELKRWATELTSNKLKVSALHVPAGASAIPAVAILGAATIWDATMAGAWTPGVDWREAWRKLPRGHIVSVRIPAASLDHLPWKGILEMLQKDSYAGNFVVEPGTGESIRQFIHLIGLVG